MLAFHRISGDGFAAGSTAGIELTVDLRAITLSGHSAGAWTGQWIEPGFAIDDIIPSWNAETPPGSLIEIELQGRTADRIETEWYLLGSWTYDDSSFKRASIAGQSDSWGSVDVDTFRAARSLDAYRLRLRLQAARTEAPTVRMVAAIASGAASEPITTIEQSGAGIELHVPAYSQSIHAGEYPEYDSGGFSWCSPTSTAMVIAYWGTGPTTADYAWVDASFADPWVDHAARYTFDHGYGGAGNWAFNTAYAAHFGLDGFVTRLRSLQEAELFLREGIPLVASIVAAPGQLDGFLLPGGTAGHLVVIVGFTSDGNPIVNDPAAVSNETVRRVYDRVQFEQVWLGGSGGVVYVISKPGVALPPSRGNW